VNPTNGHTYYLASGTTWVSGEAIAVSLGGHLATINDAAENEFVRASVLGFDGADRRGWIGYNDVASEGNFVWSSGQTPGYTQWNTGEPNNANGTEHYAEMLGSNGNWNDLPLSAAARFAIIEIEATGPVCDSIDFNNDGLLPDTLDVDDFISVFGGGACSNDPDCNDTDFNNDGLFPDTLDIDSLLSVFSGGGCL
jgi:hypothetical protein